jgi:ABC-2 type transport system ATP-binding protein
MNVIVKCEHVTKSYGNLVAVNDVSFGVEEGEIFGLVGPNGAGKTTLIEMIESLRKPDSGSIRVLGLDPTEESNRLKEKIGVLLQTTSIQRNLKVKEAIKLFASLYQNNASDSPEELLRMLSLEDKANSYFGRLSGGQKQRVAIALALVNNPVVLFLDELSTGLDPQARRNMWELVENIKNQGKTIFFTTHYMEEAEALCDRVAIIDYGKIIALDTPPKLISNLCADSRITFSVDGKDVDTAEFENIAAVNRVEKIENDFILYTRDDNVSLQELIRLADMRRFRLNNIRTKTPNLDDVFLTLTGREIRE